jgi:hypothetical protein
MPAETTFAKTIPKLYKRNFEDIAMLFFVEGQKQVIPTITSEQALVNYFRFAGIEGFDIACAKVILSRLRAEFIDLNYETTKETI